MIIGVRVPSLVPVFNIQPFICFISTRCRGPVQYAGYSSLVGAGCSKWRPLMKRQTPSSRDDSGKVLIQYLKFVFRGYLTSSYQTGPSSFRCVSVVIILPSPNIRSASVLYSKCEFSSECFFPSWVIAAPLKISLDTTVTANNHAPNKNESCCITLHGMDFGLLWKRPRSATPMSSTATLVPAGAMGHCEKPSPMPRKIPLRRFET